MSSRARHGRPVRTAVRMRPARPGSTGSSWARPVPVRQPLEGGEERLGRPPGYDLSIGWAWRASGARPAAGGGPTTSAYAVSPLCSSRESTLAGVPPAHSSRTPHASPRARAGPAPAHRREFLARGDGARVGGARDERWEAGAFFWRFFKSSDTSEGCIGRKGRGRGRGHCVVG